MCGITGFFDPRASTPEPERVGFAMAEALAHRGPDDAGVWSDPATGIVLAHRRLSILDLSPLGHQPMLSSGGRYALVYNGEVYNYRELRDELQTAGHAFRGGSDTEVLLAAFEAWGIATSVDRFVGMFAMALWDRAEHRLHLIRDRAGIKPLYYGWQNGVLLFGSELKALRIHPAFPGEVDRDALALFLRYGYIPAPYSIYRGIYKLPPGCRIEVTADADPARHCPWPETAPLSPVAYWSARRVWERGRRHPFGGSLDEAIDELERWIQTAVADRLVADVPLGAFLSGGIDSSLVVALMQRAAGSRVRTFTIGFDAEGYDESGYARAVADHLGTEHTEMRVGAADALALIPELPTIYDEPFADSSQVPTVLLSRLTRQHVTVSLSGDGGDELFAGYPRYLQGLPLWQKLVGLPRGVRLLMTAAVRQSLSRRLLAGAFGVAGPLLGPRLRVRRPQEMVEKAESLLTTDTVAEFYRRAATLWDRPERLALASHEPGGLPVEPPRESDALRGMMALDFGQYLPDDILVKVDRASMSVGLEARVPLLDHRVVEFAATLPAAWLTDAGGGKAILRRVLHRHVPAPLVERPKAGFALPFADWLRHDLRDWAEDLLSEKRLREQGYLAPEPVRYAWQEHLSGRRDLRHRLWCVLMFQAWVRS